MKHAPKKSLGQNFLIDVSFRQKIVDALDLSKSDTVIEIGPGHGEITEKLRGRGGVVRIILIEKDSELIPQLQKKFQDKGMKIIEGDVLNILPKVVARLSGIRYKIVGNIPYYITGKLLRVIGELPHLPSITVLTIQKEVAFRIVANPPGMNLLGASVQFWADPRVVALVPREAFRPKPKVDSAIIEIHTKKGGFGARALNYYALVKILFKQPRKTILNNIKPLGERGALAFLRAQIDLSQRPQNITQEQLVRVAQMLEK